MTGAIAESIHNFLDIIDKLPIKQKGKKDVAKKERDQRSVIN